MSNFPSTRSPQKCNFSNRKRRKVVVQHEAFFGFAFEDFEALHVVAGAQRGGDQGLGFAAGEDGGAVGAGQDADFDPDVADLIEGAAVGTPFVVDDLFAEDALAKSFEVGLEFLLRGFVFGRDGGLQPFLQLADQSVAFRLGVFLGVEAVGEVGSDAVLQVVEVSLVELGRSYLALRLPCFLPQIVDGGANLFDFGVGELDGVHNRFFLHFLGAGFDHHDAFGSSDHHDVQETLAHLGVGRVDDECAIDQAYADCADRAFERNVGNGECG